MGRGDGRVASGAVRRTARADAAGLEQRPAAQPGLRAVPVRLRRRQQPGDRRAGAGHRRRAAARHHGRARCARPCHRQAVRRHRTFLCLVRTHQRAPRAREPRQPAGLLPRTQPPGRDRRRRSGRRRPRHLQPAVHVVARQGADRARRLPRIGPRARQRDRLVPDQPGLPAAAVRRRHAALSRRGRSSGLRHERRRAHERGLQPAAVGAR
ncbi:hypothetical protein D9M68_733350 [compost metagenome]